MVLMSPLLITNLQLSSAEIKARRRLWDPPKKPKRILQEELVSGNEVASRAATPTGAIPEILSEGEYDTEL
jgi:hypothetical protein